MCMMLAVSGESDKWMKIITVDSEVVVERARKVQRESSRPGEGLGFLGSSTGQLVIHLGDTIRCLSGPGTAFVLLNGSVLPLCDFFVNHGMPCVLSVRSRCRGEEQTLSHASLVSLLYGRRPCSRRRPRPVQFARSARRRRQRPARMVKQ